jgi:4-amino-4-deoxy-L-arabinose transferase-like glycosyltransferase
MGNLIKKLPDKWDIFNTFLILLTSPLFFYKLGQSSLVSWDEAWYAVIARNIINSGNLFVLTFNQSYYNDHPPFGFWLIAISMKFLGQSEFAVRLPSAIAGLLTMFFLYLLGKNLFNRGVGIISALALSSTFWFIHRAREGDLDVFLTLLFVLTFYLALKAAKNYRYLVPFVLSFSALILTKTLVPLTAIPALIIIFWGSKQITLKRVIIPTVFFILIMAIWLYNEYKYTPQFIERYFAIGLPGVKVKTSYLDNLRLMKDYLYNGIGRWFWPSILSLILGVFTFQKRFIILAVFFVCFFAPFLTSNKGQIWHLIPLYPFMLLACFGLAYLVFNKSSTIFINALNLPHKKYLKSCLPYLFLIAFGLYIYLPQLRQLWYQVDIPAYRSDEEVLSKEAGKYEQPFVIDDTFGPTALYYSEKKDVKKYDQDNLEPLFNDTVRYVLITRQWRLDKSHIPTEKYEVLMTDRDKILLKTK